MSRGHDDLRRDWTARPEYDLLGRPLPPRSALSANRGEPPPTVLGSEEQPGGEGGRQLGRRAAVHLLSSRAALREAILLAEILGPPKALRPPESGRDAR